MITELIYSHILNMKWGSLHTRSIGRIHFFVLDTEELDGVLRAWNVSGTFEKRSPIAVVVFLNSLIITAAVKAGIINHDCRWLGKGELRWKYTFQSTPAVNNSENMDVLQLIKRGGELLIKL